MSAETESEIVQVEGWRAPTERPTIQVSNRDLHALADEAWAALVAANDPRFPEVLVRGRDLVRVVGGVEGEPVALQPYSRTTLRDRMSQTAEYLKPSGEGFTRVSPPQEVADVLLERDPSTYTDAPRVSRVVDVPVFGADGSLIIEPGYHQGAGIFYAPAPDFVGWVPDIVTNDFHLLERARQLLLADLLGDFPFVDDADRANALALLLLPFARELIEGTTPLHLVQAPTQGTGKGLLVQAALLPGCGTVSLTAGAGDEDAEWRKKITTMLKDGGPAVAFDNLTGKLESPALAAAITSPVWSDRLLGVSQAVTVPVRNAWAATANNLRLGGDFPRRTAPIFLDARVERPWERSGFSHPNLLAWGRENRRDLVWAGLTLIQNWLDGGWTASQERTGDGRIVGTRVLGSFEGWASVMGGILEANGVDGFMENHEKLLATANEEHDELAAFLTALAPHAIDPVSVSEMVDLATVGVPPPLEDALPGYLRGRPADELQRRLPSYLRKNRDRIAGGFRLELVEAHRNGWRVVTVAQN